MLYASTAPHLAPGVVVSLSHNQRDMCPQLQAPTDTCSLCPPVTIPLQRGGNCLQNVRNLYKVQALPVGRWHSRDLNLGLSEV